jgi:hypothetical protein
MSAEEVMAVILHMAQNMDEEVTAPGMPAPYTSAPPISAFVAASRGSNSERGLIQRGTRGGRGLPSKCSACGSPNHFMSSCTTSDDALLKWTLAKRKMIVQKYGTPLVAVLLRTLPCGVTSPSTTLTSCLLSRIAQMNTKTPR